MALVVSDAEFETLVAQAIDALHKQFDDAQNVGVVIAEEPTDEQREKFNLRGDQTLFGLYEGTPLTARHNGYGSLIPDKITLFKGPLCAYAQNIRELQKEIHHTLWHELAHHFGLDHAQIHEKE